MQNQLRLLISQFFEANLALNLFISATRNPPSFADREAWERDSTRRAEISREIEQERGGCGSADWDAVRLEAEVRFKREKWANGGIPREFEHNVPFVYARAFLYALDAFDKMLGVLARETGVPGELAEWHQKIEDAFPNLRGVRNTAQHIEDRARGLGAGKNPKPLDLKPVQNALINAPGGVLILNSLNGSRYGSTMADGHYGEVDVSPESMGRLQCILEGVLARFCWRGPKEHLPSA
ncbi:hypothetical protein [Aromatoleum toluvorans]|nr:hypothetical protein [Aromatoleum toluvorans]